MALTVIVHNSLLGDLNVNLPEVNVKIHRPSDVIQILYQKGCFPPAKPVVTGTTIWKMGKAVGAVDLEVPDTLQQAGIPDGDTVYLDWF